ncbi:hypothetical protein AAHZ94_12305 [Streptomyces sp. HSW2009]|uniref:hypothetical protein n=1 Tax=Streptomyces sp. HSW2009 TaxID=3142890 RepID=UPI0032F07635
MFSLRLVLGAGPLVQVRRSLVALASAGVGFLLLCSLGYALGHPDETSESVARLLWCAAPLAATVQLALSVDRVDSPTRSVPPGLAAAGYGPFRRSLLAAAATALICSAGSLLALFVFVYLRGSLVAPPSGGPAIDALAVGYHLPAGAVLTLLSVLPVLAAAASAYGYRAHVPSNARPARAPRSARTARAAAAIAAASCRPAPYISRTALASPEPVAPQSGIVPSGGPPLGIEVAAPSTTATPEPTSTDTAPSPHTAVRTAVSPSTAEVAGLPWGVALISVGLALEAYVSRDTSTTQDLIPMPGQLSGSAIAVLAAWFLASMGLVLAGPGLVRGCGQLLTAGRPGGVRLLAGRGLQDEAGRLGRPLGALCAVASSTYVATRLHDAVPGLTADRPLGPLTGLGAALVVGCTTATALLTMWECRHARATTTQALLRLGTPRTALRNAAALRVAAVMAVLTSLTWLVAELAVMPLVP